MNKQELTAMVAEILGSMTAEEACALRRSRQNFGPDAVLTPPAREIMEGSV